MKFYVKKSEIGGEVTIPGSKSHTIRAMAVSLLSRGSSVIRKPLLSSDTESCLKMIENFGAEIEQGDEYINVKGVGKEPAVSKDVIDVGNSGTSLYIGMGIASAVNGYTVFTGDSQIRNRTAGALLRSINDLGGEAFSTRGNDKPPLVIKGPIEGGTTSVEAVTSQYLSSLLIITPLLKKDTNIDVPLLNEKPYVTMTLGWLDKFGIEYKNDNYRRFIIKGNQEYPGFDQHIPADFSSATFFLVAAAITGSTLLLKGLDFNDTQGDKGVVSILEKMGVNIEMGDMYIKLKGGHLKGGVFDLNSMPDSLPALAVAGCFAEGETRLINVPQARIKETDRISVMNRELSKLGAVIEELEDGLIIKGGRLSGGEVNGHGDHRVVMALSVAGLGCREGISVDTAESVSITFPNFFDLMKSIGAEIKELEE